MGWDESGFFYLDSLVCYMCYSVWIFICYGCYVEVDMWGIQWSFIFGVMIFGKVIGGCCWVAIDDFIFMFDIWGCIVLFMLVEKMFFSVYDGNGDLLIDRVVCQGLQG